MFKNVASQKFIVFAFDSATNLPKTGDGANLTAYVSKDFGTVTVLGDTSATEMDSTNAKGYYLFDAAQAETNADCLLVSAKSSTSGIVVVGAPAAIFTYPTTGILAPATLGRTLVVDASGLADANAVKCGASGSGVAITGRDIGASVLLSNGSGSGQISLSSGSVAITSNIKNGQALTSFMFMMTDSTNHNPATGKTVTCTRSIDGGAFAAGSLANEAEVSNGMYKVDFGAGDLTGKVIILRCVATGCDDTFERVITQS